MSEHITEMVNDLVAQIKQEKLSAFDVAEELSKVTTRIEELERRNDRLNSDYAELVGEKAELQAEVEQLRKLELGAQELVEDRETLERERFEFNTEKKYLLRENDHLREMLSAVVARVRIDERFDHYQTSGDTVNWYKNHVIEKPKLGKP